MKFFWIETAICLGDSVDLSQRRSEFHAHLSDNFPKVYNYVRRLVRRPETAEDLTQEAFLKAWQAFDRFDPQKSFLPWILQIARHTALDYFRKHRELILP
ncbi:MAG: RNA polymerase sigma factor, partial [Candidatus Firestonebacteria bacterium]|nr:RNA polymerase sigma factor [Candidatus Firestonebacteria bacterium]